MINYENALRDFYAEVIVYLTERLRKAKDKHEFDCITSNIEKLKILKSKPVYYSNYENCLENHLILEFDGFDSDDKIYSMFSRVLKSASDLMSPYDYYHTIAKKVFQDAYKEIKLKNAKNVFEKIKLNVQRPKRVLKKYNQR